MDFSMPSKAQLIEIARKAHDRGEDFSLIFKNIVYPVVFVEEFKETDDYYDITLRMHLTENMRKNVSPDLLMEKLSFHFVKDHLDDKSIDIGITGENSNGL